MRVALHALAGLVGGIHSLGDYAFPSLTPSALEHFLAVAFDGFCNGEVRAGPLPNKLQQSRTRLRPRFGDEGIIAIHQNIEQYDCRWGRGGKSLDHSRLLDVHSALELLEPRRLSVDKCHNLTVEKECAFCL